MNTYLIRHFYRRKLFFWYCSYRNT